MLELLLLSAGPSFPCVVNVLATLLFTLELYHVVGHVCVLFRVRLLPRRDLVRIRYYFLFDTLTVFTVCFLYTGRLRWLAALQMMQHLYFFFTWNNQAFTNKVKQVSTRGGINNWKILLIFHTRVTTEASVHVSQFFFQAFPNLVHRPPV